MTIEKIFPDISSNVYLKEMFSIIDYRKKNVLKQIPVKERTDDYVYCEKHHIIPRCVFKKYNHKVDNSKNNIVYLTVFEHLKVHYLLALYYKKVDNALYNSMMFAIQYIINKNMKYNLVNINNILKNKDRRKEIEKIKSESSKIKAQLMSSNIRKYFKNHINVFKVSPPEKKMIDKKDVNKYLNDGWLLYNDYIIKKCWHLFNLCITNGFDAVKQYGYTSSKKSLQIFIRAHISNQMTTEQKDKLNKILIGNVLSRRFYSNDEIDFMKTHSFKECVEYLKGHSKNAIYRTMRRLGLLKLTHINSTDETDRIIQNNNIEDSMKILNWNKEKIQRRLFILKTHKNRKKRGKPFEKYEDDYILSHSLRNSSTYLKRSIPMIRERKKILLQLNLNN